MALLTPAAPAWNGFGQGQVIATPLGAGGRTAMKEINVIGTMQLLAACQKAPSMRKLVVKSTTAVYGSSPRDPALFTEDAEPRALPKSGYAKDAVEVKGYVRGLARRRTDLTVSVLRFANMLLEPLWNRSWVRDVQITISETVGVEGRGEFYDRTGALRDMVQSHVLQLTSLVAVAPCASRSVARKVYEPQA